MINFRVKLTIKCLLILGVFSILNNATSEPLIVMETRGFKAKVGSSIDSDKPIKLEEGERITLIRADGISVTLRGPFNDVPMPKKSTASDPKQALAALVATRDARTNSVGAIRAGTDAKAIPDPWLIDVTRPGVRCLGEGQQPVFWRPDAAKESRFTIAPSDRSYKVDLIWPASQTQFKPEKINFKSSEHFLTVILDDQEFNIQIIEIPKEIPEGLLLTGWMLEKSCVQQADALIKKLQEGTESKP